MTGRTYGTLLHRIIAALLLTTVRSLASGAPYSTAALTGKTRLAASSTMAPVVPLKTPRRVAAANLDSSRSRLRAVISEPDAKPRKAAAPILGPLDLRPPVLCTSTQLPMEATRPADAEQTPHFAIVGKPAWPEESSSLAHTGIGAIYWAASHPAQAWRVVLPVVADDGSAASADVKAECANIRPPGGQTSCP
jgi:hypothetical protein